MGRGDDQPADRLGLTKTFPSDGALGQSPAPGPTAGEAGTTTEKDLVGTHIGSYKVVRELGRGGMGIVYEAVHETLGQRAAVKILKSDAGPNPVLGQRFLTEARAITIAQHPGLVKVFDFGQLPDKTLYILMEFLEGESLETRLSKGPIAEEAAVRLGRQVASAIGVAHARGIVHRDLKPSNLYIVRDPEAPSGERVKVLDFGLAKILSEAPGGSVRTTATGTIMGTPLYMSPEQCRGLTETTGKTDVYALGVILFEMLAGSPPFHADTAGDLLVMHINRPPPRLARQARASRQVTELVDDMLKKNPDERPSMAEVEARLQPDQQGRVGRSSPRRPRSLIGAAVLALGIACSVGLFFAVTRGPGPRRGDPQAGTPLLTSPVTPSKPVLPVAAADAVPTPKPAPWTLSSEPSGAMVLRAADRAPLGMTPFSYEPRAGEEQLAALIEYPGYVSEPITLSRTAPSRERVALRKLPTVEPAPEPSTKSPARKPGRGANAMPPASEKGAAKGRTPATPASPAPETKKPDSQPEDVDVPAMR